jgi:hypothetical protein
LKVQTTVVNKGAGTFTLFLPMSCRGWPHVSFYPADNGEGFGGNYFGTGDSVLKQWWAETPVGTGKTRVEDTTARGSEVTSSPPKYPAVYVFYSEQTGQAAHLLFGTLYPKLTHHLTGRSHSVKDYQEQFTKWTKTGDTLVLLLCVR